MSLCLHMQTVGLLHGLKACSQVILSDANSVYIAEILAHHGLQVQSLALLHAARRTLFWRPTNLRHGRPRHLRFAISTGRRDENKLRSCKHVDPLQH